MIRTTEQERTKYRRMWTEVPGYRCTSPGEQLVPHFLRVAKWAEQDTLIDLGCGPGRASVLLADAGLEVTQLDITEHSRDFKVKKRALPFVEASLWELPELPVFDWLYCCDVMEHIPPEHVDAVLDGMRKITGKGAFMQIALSAEGFGRHIGEVLHLTVKDAEWWANKIRARWNCTKFADVGGRLVTLTEGPR